MNPEPFCLTQLLLCHRRWKIFPSFLPLYNIFYMNAYGSFLVCSVVSVYRSWLLRTVTEDCRCLLMLNSLTLTVHILLGWLGMLALFSFLRSLHVALHCQGCTRIPLSSHEWANFGNSCCEWGEIAFHCSFDLSSLTLSNVKHFSMLSSKKGLFWSFAHF